MKKLLLSFFLISWASYALCQTILFGKVIRVVDGDTFTLLDQRQRKLRIRLYGIDCPEHGQAFANVAKKFTSDRVLNKEVRVEVRDTDRYKRIIGVILLPDRSVLNRELLKAGLAWHYVYHDRSRDYTELEASAQSRKINIWSAKHPVAPWDFRRNKR